MTPPYSNVCSTVKHLFHVISGAAVRSPALDPSRRAPYPARAAASAGLQPTPSSRRLRDVASDTEAAGNARAHSRWRLAAAVAGGLTLFPGLVWAGVIGSGGHSQ